jgi:hypothetical protein
MHPTQLNFNHSPYINTRNSHSYQLGLYLQDSMNSELTLQYYKQIKYCKYTTDALGTAVKKF